MTPRAAAFIANTDFGWFSHFLHRAEPPDEVDFLAAVAGFGFFARYERVPAWLAWG